MRLVCSYCSKELALIEPLADARVSHGMCEECGEYFRRQWSGIKLGEYLDQFDRPVLVVGEKGRVIAANEPMASMLGQDARSIFGLLGGEAMECQYSRLPERCGNTVHCKTCTIRNTVQRALTTGEPQLRVPAHLDQKTATVHFMISAYPRADHVIVVIDELVGTDSMNVDS